MRRNLRLDWRALALLGALLSIIIDWPGLVYAMPTILPPASAMATEAAPIDTQNAFKSENRISFLVEQQDKHKRFTTVTPTLQQEIHLKLQKPLLQQQLTTTTTQQQLNNEILSSISRDSITIINKKQQQQQQQPKATAIVLCIENTNSLLAAANETKSLSKVSLIKNTHIKNDINKNIEYNLTKSNTTTTTTTTTATAPTTTTPPLTTTESTANIQNTLMSTTMVETVTAANLPHLQQQQQLETIFKFSSSHHLAILSRTERSIRSSLLSSSSSSSSLLSLAAYDRNSNSSSSISISSSRSNSSSSSSSSSVSGAGLMVRRSSDMSVMKSKRLNNSRNLHHKNNLDRNERSTVSHLSGPSRKIQLYIKNRFIQLLPDGTVNGTQDEQCDYICDYNDYNEDDLHN